MVEKSTPARHDRPREKLARAGADALGDNELLAVVIGHGTAEADALEIANRMLGASGGVHGLTRLAPDEFSLVAGVGRIVAGRVQAAVELGRRTLSRSPSDRPRLHSPHEAGLFLLPQFGAFPVERFGVALLDSRHRLIRTAILSVGAVDASMAHPREVFRTAVLGGASAIVAFHNHPSGDPTPSPEDVALTGRLVRAGEVLGIRLMDHLILADTRYCSMRAGGHIRGDM